MTLSTDSCDNSDMGTEEIAKRLRTDADKADLGIGFIWGSAIRVQSDCNEANSHADAQLEADGVADDGADWMGAMSALNALSSEDEADQADEAGQGEIPKVGIV